MIDVYIDDLLPHAPLELCSYWGCGQIFHIAKNITITKINGSLFSTVDSLSVDASLQGIKRPSSSQELDSEHSVKKIHLEA